MRIALVHSYYRDTSPSGENTMVDAQAAALKTAGHDVMVIGRHTSELVGDKLYGLKAAVTVASGRGPSPLRDIESFDPDLVHVHNLFPNWGTQWLDEVEVPVVATIHNYRTFCAAGTLLRDASPCTLCPEKGSHHAVIHGCYKGSRIASIPVAIGTKKNTASPLLQRADAVVFLSSRSELILKSLLPDLEKKGKVIPNFISRYPSDRQSRGSVTSAPWLFVGRLASEKGILELVKNWPPSLELNIIGEGPLREKCEAASIGKEILFLGKLGREAIFREMNQSRGLVFPSLWSEMSALVYIEALSSGLPVLAYAATSVADDILEAKTGAVFESFQDIQKGIDEIEESYPEIVTASLNRFDHAFSERVWLQQIAQLYAQLITPT